MSRTGGLFLEGHGARSKHATHPATVTVTVTYDAVLVAGHKPRKTAHA